MTGFGFGPSSSSQGTQAGTTGGLFGGSSGGGGLFGSSTAQSQPQNASAAPSSGGLFGGLGLGGGSAAPSQPAGGLFGSSTAATTSAPTGGLFGSISTAPAATGGGLFGLGAPKPSGGGLFGSSTTAAPASTGGPFGNTGAPQSTGLAAGGSSLFGPSQSQQQNSNSILGGQSTAYFDTILDRSRKRNHAESNPEDLPALQLGLGDLHQRIKRLAPGIQDRSADGRAHYLLAASGVDPGAAVRDLKQFSSTGRIERPEQDINDVDVEGYLANMQNQTTKSMIQDGLERAKQDFDLFLDEKLAMEWGESRKRIYQHFGITPKESDERSGFALSAGESQVGFGRSRRSKAAAAASSRATNGGFSESKFSKSSLARSVIGAAGPIGSGTQPLFADVEKNMESHGVTVIGPHDRFQRDKELRFTDKVRTLNSARLQKHPYAVCDEFASVVKASGEHFSAELANAYSAIMEIVGEDPEVNSLADLHAVKERQYAPAYLDENPNSVQHQQIKKRILRGGARCLEKLKFQEMEEFVSKNPREANLGGIPNVISKVKAYVRLQATRKNLAVDNADLQQLDNDYVWALIFNLLRTGHVQEAVDYVATNAVAFRAIDRNFASYITDYANSPDRRLRRDLQDRISNEYNQRVRIAPENSIDPYRMACYKIIGRCDLRNRQLEGIKLAGLPDFMWLQLALARETNRVDEIATEAYGLAEAQNLIRELGNRYFSTKSGVSDLGSSWGSFVLYQIVFGLFEEAVSYLYTYSYVDGVHLAIALDFYGLLRVSDPNAAGDDFMSTTTRGNNQINFGRMLGYYTRDFRAADVGAAVDYLSLICLNRDLPAQLDQSQTQLCHEALRELVLESREYALLLGDIRGDGQRVKGVIEERMALIGLDATDDFMRAITIQAASIADDNGRTTDAVLLYHLAGEFDNVMVIITRALSESVNVPIGQEQMRLQVLKPRPDDQTQPREKVPQTLSLTAIDDPITLANAMVSVYSSNSMYSSRIKDVNKSACQILLKMDVAKQCVEASRWTEALDVISELSILPLEARGNASTIRSYATKFSGLSQPVANCVPSLLMWTVTACNSQRSHLMKKEFGGNEGTRFDMIKDLKQKNLDLTTYTSQLRYRFPAHLHEALAKAQSE